MKPTSNTASEGPPIALTGAEDARSAAELARGAPLARTASVAVDRGSFASAVQRALGLHARRE